MLTEVCYVSNELLFFNCKIVGSLFDSFRNKSCI
jgi:hypothetical protein